jgi:ornithine carbamoyltransferase
MSVFNMKGRSLLSLYDLTDAEMLGLLDMAAAMKKRKKKGIRGNLLERRHIALVFEKASTRTRCAATVAAEDEGGCVEYLSADSIHLGKKESVADTARVLGRMFDGIMFRGYAQATATALAKYAGIPVWNGLTDDEHPTQALADIMTVRERFTRIKGLRLAYVGDGRNNVAVSLMQACAKVGIDFVNVTPRELTPCDAAVRRAGMAAKANGTTVRIVHDPHAGVKGANVICTDVWTSMGEEKKFRERVRLLRPYQVNSALIKATGNMASGRVIFLHCLPAFHNSDTTVTRDIGALEVTDEVFEAPYSRVFDEAENRVHTIKALFVASLGRVSG